MRSVKMKYNFINLIILLLTAWMFVYGYSNAGILFQDEDVCRVLIVMGTALSVHMIKGGRLYLVLYGSDIKLSTYVKIYCKVTPVSVVIPYKSGEFFRMYCYGKQLKNMLKGIVVVLLDRFMDTAALVTMILLAGIFNGGSVGKLVYALIVFLVFVLLVYVVFPGIYQFWKEYLLSAKATRHGITILKILKALDEIYQEIISVTKGRGILLYFLSFIAWTVEIGGIVLVNGIIGEDKINDIISDYLSSAMGTGDSVELKHFVFISVLMLTILYAAIKIAETIRKKRA